MLQQSSFSIEGVWEKAKPKVVVEVEELLIRLLKYQFLHFIQNTTYKYFSHASLLSSLNIRYAYVIKTFTSLQVSSLCDFKK